MTFAWGCDDLALRCQEVTVIRERFLASGIQTRYYTPELHVGAFALPRYVLEAIGKTIS